MALDDNILYEDIFLKISIKLEDNYLSLPTILCFTGVGFSLGGINIQKNEFTKFKSKIGNQIFIIDKQRSWGNNLDFKLIKSIIAPYLSSNIISLGNSMGGFLAVISTNFFDCSKCIAFNYQYSVNPNIVPEEMRWKEYTQIIDNWQFPSLQGMFNYKTKYYLFTGGMEREIPHYTKVPNKKNVLNIVFTDFEHDIAVQLKQKNFLYLVISDIIEGRFNTRHLMKEFKIDVQSTKPKFIIFTKQKNEGLYLLDWVSWHQTIGMYDIQIVSNDCSDHSDTLLDAISEEIPNIQHIKVTDEPLKGRSVGQRTTSKLNELVLNNRGSFAITMDIDEYICFRDPKITDISSLNFVEDKCYFLPWLNCLPEDIFNNSGEPPYQRSTKAITKKNDAFPYINGYAGKQLRYNHEGVTLENFHHFSVNGEEIKKGEPSGIYLKHCVTNSLEEFMLRGERGEAATFASQGQNIAEREKNAYKYAIDLFLMYISQETTPNILPNKAIAKKAAEVRAELLSNPKIKAAQDKIDGYYRRKFSKIKKTYIPSIFRELNIQHIDDLKTKELEKFNKQFFSSKSKKPHDFYVLMSLANLFEKEHEKARQYATEGLMIYPSFKLLLMAQSSILQNPYYAVP